jgi:hypothetical protein
LTWGVLLGRIAYQRAIDKKSYRDRAGRLSTEHGSRSGEPAAASRSSKRNNVPAKSFRCCDPGDNSRERIDRYRT